MLSSLASVVSKGSAMHEPLFDEIDHMDTQLTFPLAASPSETRAGETCTR